MNSCLSLSSIIESNTSILEMFSNPDIINVTKNVILYTYILRVTLLLRVPNSVGKLPRYAKLTRNLKAIYHTHDLDRLPT